MFILRRITSISLEINTCLNTEYVLVLKERCKDEFDRTCKLMQWHDDESTKDVYGFVTFNDGGNIMPLYKDSNYYIMGSDGNTVANISYKQAFVNIKLKESSHS